MTQRLYVYWDSSKSQCFFMQNGIRQGSVLSPVLFNIYVDELNVELCNAGVGCHVGGRALNNFSYADDLAILAPNARSLNMLLQVCRKFAADNYISFSTEKSVCMLIRPRSMTLSDPPNIYLGDVVLEYVDSFKYLGHIISSSFKDDDDIKRETRSLCIRGNILIRKFNFCTEDVKIALFKSFCYPLYTSSLWSRYNASTLYRLKVTYNNVMRRLLGVPQWESARQMFVAHGVRSLDENLRYSSYGMWSRVASSDNEVLVVLHNSDSRVLSAQVLRWQDLLY